MHSIGEGTFGEVVLATNSVFGKIAVKWLKVCAAALDVCTQSLLEAVSSGRIPTILAIQPSGVHLCKTHPVSFSLTTKGTISTGSVHQPHKRNTQS